MNISQQSDVFLGQVYNSQLMENYVHHYTVIEFFVMNSNLFILPIFVEKTQRGWFAGFSLYISNT